MALTPISLSPFTFDILAKDSSVRSKKNTAKGVAQNIPSPEADTFTALFQGRCSRHWPTGGGDWADTEYQPNRRTNNPVHLCILQNYHLGRYLFEIHYLQNVVSLPTCGKTLANGSCATGFGY
jgi:hypothetical protein